MGNISLAAKCSTPGDHCLWLQIGAVVAHNGFITANTLKPAACCCWKWYWWEQWDWTKTVTQWMLQAPSVVFRWWCTGRLYWVCAGSGHMPLASLPPGRVEKIITFQHEILFNIYFKISYIISKTISDLMPYFQCISVCLFICWTHTK